MTGNSNSLGFMQRAAGWCEAVKTECEYHPNSFQPNPIGSRCGRFPALLGQAFGVLPDAVSGFL